MRYISGEIVQHVAIKHGIIKDLIIWVCGCSIIITLWMLHLWFFIPYNMPSLIRKWKLCFENIQKYKIVSNV